MNWKMKKSLGIESLAEMSAKSNTEAEIQNGILRHFEK